MLPPFYPILLNSLKQFSGTEWLEVEKYKKYNFLLLYMNSVKIRNKSLLEKLQAKITLKMGKKMSQQDILDKSIEFVYNRLEEFLSQNIDHPEITNKLIERIRSNAIKAPLAHLEKSDDELLYGY